MNYSVILLCAGSGKRTGLTYNKIFYKWKDKTVYEMTINTFLDDDKCKQVIVVTKENEIEELKKLSNDHRIEYTWGGKERQDSVYNGIQLVNNEYVLIHDGARPFVSYENIKELLTCLNTNDACLLMVPCIDTVKEVVNGKVVKTLNRANLMQAQTPQAFKTDLIKDVYKKAIDDNFIATDDSQLVECFSDTEIKYIIGNYDNKKITTKDDL